MVPRTVCHQRFAHRARSRLAGRSNIVLQGLSQHRLLGHRPATQIFQTARPDFRRRRHRRCGIRSVARSCGSTVSCRQKEPGDGHHFRGFAPRQIAAKTCQAKATSHPKRGRISTFARSLCEDLVERSMPTPHPLQYYHPAASASGTLETRWKGTPAMRKFSSPSISLPPQHPVPGALPLGGACPRRLLCRQRPRWTCRSSR